MKIILETERFYMREFNMADVDEMFELDADPEVHRYLGNNPSTSKEQAEQYIENILHQYKDYGLGRLAVVDKKNKNFIGWSGLKFERILVNDTTDYYDLGFRIKKKYWGMGIATETSKELLRYGFKDLNLKEICAAAHIDNIGSNKVLQKIGMNFIEKFIFMDIDCNWYKLSSSEFLNIQTSL